MQTLASDLWVPAPIEMVWSFASKVENLAKISPPTFPISVKSGGPTEKGTKHTITVSPMGFSIVWIAHIVDVVSEGSKRYFIDVQEKGPFAFWKHQHIFESGEKGVEGQRSRSEIKSLQAGTWIQDRVEFELGFGALGRLANKAFVHRQLEDMFAYRREKLWQQFSQIPS